MTNNNFKGKFNYRLMGVHLMATIFLLLGAQRFSMLYDLDLTQAFYEYGYPEFAKHLTDKTGTMGERLYYILCAKFFAGLLALLISFGISLTISLRARIFWLNSFIVLIVGYAINKFDLLNFEFIKTDANGFNNLFIFLGFKYAIIINATLLITIGLLIYFNKWTRNFIMNKTDTNTADKNSNQTNEAGPTQNLFH